MHNLYIMCISNVHQVLFTDFYHYSCMNKAQLLYPHLIYKLSCQKIYFHASISVKWLKSQGKEKMIKPVYIITGLFIV